MGSPPAPLYIYDCKGERTHQQWVFNRNRTITHVPTGYVIDVEGGSKKNERPVVLSLPVADRDSQQWSRPSRLGGNVHAMYAGKCLTLASLTNGEQAAIATCLTAQEWTYHPLTQRFTVHGDGTEKCLSAVGAGSGAAVIIDECRADPNQHWIPRVNSIGGTIVSAASVDPDNPGAELCMTLPGTRPIMESGTKVELRPCASDTADPNQQWIWP